MPRADHFPAFSTELSEVPSPTNPLGIKAGGEGGTTPAPAAVANAIVDALAEFGVREIALPATAHAIWRGLPPGGEERDSPSLSAAPPPPPRGARRSPPGPA